ncbi:hypothetical protein HNR39_004372 [Glaciimonas immobilis]|uniref:Uncharacterized protein n=1 Tax=Glaciimonas immobilis TaxID=728004 RepID=A0A840RX78_9BURK|nr:hypothetical protein [Glaciimonas immobilis]
MNGCAAVPNYHMCHRFLPITALIGFGNGVVDSLVYFYLGEFRFVIYGQGMVKVETPLMPTFLHFFQ